MKLEALLIFAITLLVKSTIAGNSDPSQAEAICAELGSNNILVAHEHCSKFYKCFHGKPVAIDCPDNLNYNPDKEYCDWPENVKCLDRPVPGVGEVKDNVDSERDNSDPSQASVICAAEGSDSILVAHEDCTKFYKCFQGRPVAIDCPESLYYNPDKEYCDWPENVKCLDRPVPGVGEFKSNEDSERDNSDPSQASVICAAEGSDSILVAHEDCSKFYKCFQGKPVAIDCPENLYYNPDKEYCDWPENVKCLDRPVPGVGEVKSNENIERDNSDPSQALAICAAEGSDSILVAHEDCSKFYKCFQGKPVAIDCPENLYYNPDKEYCDWPENVKCNRI